MPLRNLKMSHSTVVAYLALFVALGGTAFAAATITGRDVVDGSLTGADLRNGSVSTLDVRRLTGADLGPGEPWRLRSPNGQFSVSVTNSGVTIQGPGGQVSVDGSDVEVQGQGGARLNSAGITRINGSQVHLNGGCAPLANPNLVFQHTHTAPSGGGTTTIGAGAPPFGSPTLLAC